MIAVRRVVVVGAGAGGAELARILAQAGLQTMVFDPDPDVADRVAHVLHATAARYVGAVDQVGPIDAVLIAEPLIDPDVFGQSALIASCSPNAPQKHMSFLPVAPVHLRPLVEIRACDGQDSSVAFDLARQLQKVPILAPQSGWSLATRLIFALNDAATRLVLMGAVPHEVDEAMVAFGFDLGVFEAQDLIGLDVGYVLRRDRGDKPAHWAIPDRMVEEGRLGHKASVGWYRYPGGGGAVIDPLVEDLAREEAWFAGCSTRDVSGDEIIETVLAALRAEGKNILDQDLASDVEQINQISTLGLGYPVAQPGLMTSA
ncbi:MAG: 3-hydroxyacyl-CoA dehydrogenase family protein [Sedimentitalea sp.]